MNSKTKLKAMTLVEVLVALAIVSFVFSALTSIAFESLARAKKLELQDQMRSYAVESSEFIYNLKDTSWKNNNDGFTDVFNTEGKTVVLYDTTDVDGKIIKKLANAPTNCYLNQNTKTLSADCENGEYSSLPQPEGKNQSVQNFGRILIGTPVANPNTGIINEVKMQIIIACIEGKCDSTDFQPFILNFTVYRTSGAN